MKAKKTTLLLGSLLLCGSLSVSAQQLAFPGAQGWGRFATGGRTGTVYHVTNLNDSGTGSLRDAVSQPNRIVVFDVAGVIRINTRIVFAKNLYVAGQTAPGEGITVYGNGVSFSGATNTIVRYMRFRMGKVGDSGKDCAGIANGTDMIFDHCSFSWGLDETFSINPDGKGTKPENITISNTIMGQGLMTHSAGGLMQSDNITLYRNLYVDNSTRNNKIKGINQYVNNIVYNWKNAAYNMGGDSEGESYCNIESNLFINGPAKGGAAFTGGNSNFHFYGDDNWQDNNMDGKFDPSLVTNYSAADRQNTPYPYPELEKFPGNTLVDNLLPTVGASLPYRDLADCYMIDEVYSFGTKGALIYDEKSLFYGTPDTWNVWVGNKRVDTDGDGMPDAWETANGTDPNKNDAMTIAANGYANIENYINSITRKDRDFFLRAPLCLQHEESTQNSITVSWLDYSDNEDGFIVELEKNGEFVEVGRVAADVKVFTITDESLEPMTPYNIRVRAFTGENVSEYSNTLTAKTRPVPVDVVDIDTYAPDYTWAGGSGAWNMASTNWAEGGTYTDGKNVLIAPTENIEVDITENVQPAAVVVNGSADVTLKGTGAIAGASSLNKAGTGALIVQTPQSYEGATVLHDGTYEFSTIANGGVASGVGASQEFAQNWIWAGGTYKYTGASASTNRSATLDGNTTFNIENKAAAISMSGSIEGVGNLTVDGAGQITVNNTEFFKYDGNLIMKGGKVLLNGEMVSKAGLGTVSKLVMCGGTFATSSGNDRNPTYTFPIEITEDTHSSISFFRNCLIKSAVSGSGTVDWEVNWVREYIEGDWSKFTGRVIVNGTGKAANSQFAIRNGSGIQNGTFTLKGTAQIVGGKNESTYYLGGLSGAAGTFLSGFDVKNAGRGTWIVGSANTDETFEGVIDGRAQGGKDGTTSIEKVGSGDWRLTGKNIYKGTTQIRGGRLVVNGNNSGAGAYTVNANATLAGKGTVGGAVSVKSDGIVFAGDTLIDGSTLTLGKTLNVASGAIVSIPATAATCNSLTLKGNMTIADGATLKFAEEGLDKAPYDATVYQVFNLAGGTISGTFANVELPELGKDQTWDLSSLYTEGTIKVVGGEKNPGGGDEPGPGPDDPSETKTALLTWGNMTPGSYDGVGTNNMLTGTVGDDAEGFSLVVTGNLSKNFSNGDKINVEYKDQSLTRTTIKLSNGAEESVFLPSGAKATKITLWSYTNVTTANRTSYWANVAGTAYTEENSVILAPTKDTKNPNKVSFDLADVADVVTFKNTGEQQCVIIYLEYHTGGTSGCITTVGGDNTPVRIDYYTVSGERVATPGKGLYIMRATTAAGKTITRKVVLQ